jgi:hypothetical protein
LQTRKMTSSNNSTFTNAPIIRSITHTLNLFHERWFPRRILDYMLPRRRTIFKGLERFVPRPPTEFEVPVVNISICREANRRS